MSSSGGGSGLSDTISSARESRKVTPRQSASHSAARNDATSQLRFKKHFSALSERYLINPPSRRAGITHQYRLVFNLQSKSVFPVIVQPFKQQC